MNLPPPRFNILIDKEKESSDILNPPPQVQYINRYFFQQTRAKPPSFRIAGRSQRERRAQKRVVRSLAYPGKKSPSDQYVP